MIMKKDYTLKTNEYGNVIVIPEGWMEVNLHVAKLKSLGIPHYKAFVGWNKRSKKYINPILVNIIPKAYKSVLTKKLNAEKEKNSEKTKKAKWVARLVKLSGCEEQRAIRVWNLMIEEKKNKLHELRGGKRTIAVYETFIVKQLSDELKNYKLDYVKSKAMANELLEKYV